MDDEQQSQLSEGVEGVEPELETPQEETTTAEEKAEKAALVINVYSWMTPVFGILMLAAGLLLGYFGRPLLTGENPAAADTVAVTAAPDVSSSAEQAPTGADQASPEEMMAFLTSQVRHFKGSETAPITIIEFSDFQ